MEDSFYTIGVVAAEVNSIEQRQIMKGVITQAQKLGHRIVVFSNVYNPYDSIPELALENQIYELVRAPELRALILIAESFVNLSVREKVKNFLLSRLDIPIIIIGIRLEELAFPNVHFINANDADDMDDITTHLILENHLRRIDILTGMRGNEASEKRVAGYRRAMEREGLPFSMEHVHYGNFWMDSGEELAKRYASHELPLPEAVICANDYMAYGMLDTFLEKGIRVPQDVIVTGYEYIYERVFHTPLLTTYQRGREELGASAVSMICTLLSGKEPEPFIPPKGKWIAGRSCPETEEFPQLQHELSTLRVKQQFDKWNVFSTMEQRLTQCSNLTDFIKVLGEHQYLVRWVQNMFLCLCENWYDNSAETPSEQMVCYSIMPWNGWMPPITCSRFSLSALYAHSPKTAAHYYLPLFFEKHLFGYFVLEYHAPDTYDDIFRNWLKSLTISLEVLSMKNDIRCLLQCQNLSEQLDSLTGLYNQNGVERALTARLSSEKEQPVYAIALQIHDLQQQLDTKSQASLATLIQDTADAIRAVIGTQNSICGRMEKMMFVCIGFPCSSREECSKLRNKLMAVLLNQTRLMRTCGMESMISCWAEFSGEQTPGDCLSQLREKLAEEIAKLTKQKSRAHAGILFAVRNQLYDQLSLPPEEICRRYSLSAGYFRQIYKDMFNISYHQDTINARIARAVYLLSTTVMSVASVAEQCGYEDTNFFLRQFKKTIGIPPGKFRRKL